MAITTQNESSDRKRYDEIMISVMFSAFVFMWIGEWKHLLLQSPSQWTELFNIYSHSKLKFYLGLVNFGSLVCFWWWYTKIFFNKNIYTEKTSILDLCLMLVLALSYSSWYSSNILFGLLLTITSILIYIRNKIIINVGLNDTPEFTIFKKGTRFICILIVFTICNMYITNYIIENKFQDLLTIILISVGIIYTVHSSCQLHKLRK